MDKLTAPKLEGVAQTLLMTLYTHARESQRPDAMFHDEKAVEVVAKLDCDFSRLKLQGHDEVGLAMRVRRFDAKTREFLERNHDGVVVQFGCGLDTRFDRLDDGQVEWLDIDLAEVVELRKNLIGPDGGRYHLFAGSAFEDSWLQAAAPFAGRPFLFIAEGVFPYFKEAEISGLFLKLLEHFPGAEIVCDAHTPFVIRMDNLQLAAAGVKARLQWGLKHGRDVESWGEGIVMLDEWFYFNDPEPRMAAYRWMGRIPLLGRSTGIFHYQLGRRS